MMTQNRLLKVRKVLFSPFNDRFELAVVDTTVRT